MRRHLLETFGKKLAKENVVVVEATGNAACRALQQLGLPGRELVWMNVELLRQFDQCLFPLQGCQSHSKGRAIARIKI